MKREQHWYDFLTLNGYQLGLSMASNVISPLLLPALVLAFMPPEKKNTYTALVYVTGLAVAMFIQPVMGMWSDRSTSKYGRRRPFIFWGALLNILFLGVVGASLWFKGSPLNAFFQSAFGITTSLAVLLLGIILLQFSSNISQAGQQGLIPDIVPVYQRGRASGIKSVMEMLPAALVLLISPLLDKQKFWVVLLILMATFLVTMLITVLFTREEAQTEKPPRPEGRPILRMLLLTVIFVGVTQLALLLVKGSGNWLPVETTSLAMRVFVVGLVGLIGMAGSIFIGVYFGARVGIGKESRNQMSFIWWVVTRLLFLAAIGSVRNFAMFFVKDVLKVPNPATVTTYLTAVIFIFLLITSLVGGYLSDKVGQEEIARRGGSAGIIRYNLTGLLPHHPHGNGRGCVPWARYRYFYGNQLGAGNRPGTRKRRRALPWNLQPGRCRRGYHRIQHWRTHGGLLQRHPTRFGLPGDLRPLWRAIPAFGPALAAYQNDKTDY